MRNRKRNLFTLSTVIFSILLLFGLTAAHATTVEQHIETGETQLFSGTVSGVLDAYATFETAKGEHPDDPVINAYLAITRLLDLGLRDGDDTSGLRYLMEQYGFTLTGDNLDEMDMADPFVGDYLIIPETAPKGEAIRSFLAGTFLTALDASIANLDTTISQWNDTSKHIILKENFGFDPEALYNTELDYGDIHLFRAGLKAMKTFILIITAYDLDVDLREIAAFSNMDVTFDPNVFLARYEDFLKLLPTATTATGNGAQQLNDAKTTLIAAIVDYTTASGIIRNEGSPQPGAEELIEIDDCELLEEEWYRNSLTGLKDSLTNTTAFQIVERKEAWTFTDSASSDSINLYFEHNMSEGSFEFSDLSLQGGIECVIIAGSQISVYLSGWDFEVTFVGTYNSVAGTITGGTYSGTASGDPISGQFTGARNDSEEEIITINLNPLLDDHPDLRDLFPDFNCCREPIDGTAGHGLGDDATLGGILPGMTHEEWDFEDLPCPPEAIVIPTGTISVDDSSIADWSGIDPVYTDEIGDENLGEDDNPSGADMEQLYIAKDAQYYYFRIHLADGAPNPNPIDPYGTNLQYFFQFRNGPDDETDSPDYCATYQDGSWKVIVSENYGSNTLYGPASGDAQALANDLEWRVPIAHVVSESGKYLGSRIGAPYRHEPFDNIGTCNIMGPTATVSGTVTLPAGYDGTDPVFIGVYRFDTVTGQIDREHRLGGYIIYPGEAASYSIDNLPVGEWIIVTSLWDTDFNGIKNRGDYTTYVPPFQTTGGATTKNLTGYTEQTANDFSIQGSVMHVTKQGGSSHTFLEVCIGEDFPGWVPDDVDSITVEGPGGSIIATMDYSNYEGPGTSCYFADIEGEPDLGTYTFTVYAGPYSAVTTDTQTVNRTLPIPETAGLVPAPHATVSSRTPVFSWRPVEFEGIQLYYRLEVVNSSGVTVRKTNRIADMHYFTLPADFLTPGETYQWRVRVSDSGNWLSVQNRSQTEWQTFTMDTSLNHDATPAISLDGYGAVTFSTTDGTNIDTSILVIDYDGISHDGSSHTVTVTPPESEPVYMDFSQTISPYAAYYIAWLDYGGDFPGGAGEADFTFTVTDPDYNNGSRVDTVTVNPLDPPDESSLSPSLKDESITAHFDNVTVNGNPYDNFNTYSTMNDLNASGKWQFPACDGISIDNEALKFQKGGCIGRCDCFLPFADPSSITSVEADITVDSDTPSAKAWIAGKWYNNGTNDVWVQLTVKSTRAYYMVTELIYENGVYTLNTIAGDDLKSVSPGETVHGSISWNGSTFTFDADGTSAEFTPVGIVNPPADMSWGGLHIGTRIDLVMEDTTPDFTWNAVTDANQHRVRIYSSNGSRTIWRGYAGNATSYMVPPGVLLPMSVYRYRIDARDSHSPLDSDNVSKTPKWNSENYLFYTGLEDPIPFIDLDSMGVAAWQASCEDNPFLAFRIKVHDAQGVPGNIATVTVEYPGGATLPLAYVDDPGNTETCGVYRAYDFTATNPQGGTYTFTVEDNEGHPYNISEDLTVDLIGYPSRASMTPLDKTVIGDTAVFFDWEDVDGAAFYRVKIYDMGGNEIYAFNTTVSEYDLPAGFLKEGTAYQWRIETRREFFDENVDNGSAIPCFDDGLFTFATTEIQGTGLSDAIEILKMMVGIGSANIYGDINNDGKIGLAEVIYALQHAAELR